MNNTNYNLHENPECKSIDISRDIIGIGKFMFI